MIDDTMECALTCEEVLQEREWGAVDGGVDRACCGKSAGDNLASYFTVNSAGTWADMRGRFRKVFDRAQLVM